jgi:2-octaprenylphenol hydroxylase
MYDILIAGSGIVGSTMALALARDTSLTIGILETKLPSLTSNTAEHPLRVSAFTPASKNILQNVGCWEEIKKNQLSPYTQMHVWDTNSRGQIHFNCKDIEEPALGYIIEDDIVRTHLLKKFSQHPNIDFLCPVRLHSMHEKTDCIELTLNDKKIVRTHLLIGADGANSWVRTQANIAVTEHEYGHTAITAIVKTQLAHQFTARQCFLTQGPLAFLPLTDPHHCAVIWSAATDFADHLLTLDDAGFCDRLKQSFAQYLGEIIHITPRRHFSLRMRHAKNYVRTRLALIGDAAHTLHPLAGQGVNLGLLDAASLAEVIITAHQKGRDFASLETLRRYERWRKGDTLTMLALVAGLKNLFASEKPWVRQLRGTGLNITDHFPWGKNFLTRYAIGKRDDLPTLADGPLKNTPHPALRATFSHQGRRG